MTVKAQEGDKRRELCCPDCGERQFLVARRSITYDAWQDVRAYETTDGRKAEEQGSPELGDIEQLVTTWYFCTSPECEGSGESFQLDALVFFPRPMDLCRRCAHHYEDHGRRHDHTADAWLQDDKPCHRCGCEDFEVRIVPEDQPELPGVTIEAVRESGHHEDEVTTMAGGG